MSRTYDLQWGHDLAARITPNLRSEIGRIRATPPLIPITPGNSRYEDVVPSYRISPGPPLGIRASVRLAPIKISCEFVIAQQQFDDELLASRLALRPASFLAYAEDTILLHGSRAAPDLAAMNVKDENDTLAQQEGLLVNPPVALPAATLVTDSIRAALERLQRNQQHGPYCVVLSPDLHRDALTPFGTSTTPKIAPLLPQFRDQGFRFSEALPDRTGVVFSLGGSALDLAILWDAHVECRKVEGDATFVVVEQFRLRINDPRAVEPLT
jgi:hypothetical protein